MTSQLKTAVTVNDGALVEGTGADASDVSSAVNSNLDNVRDGWLSVSSSDTHVKHLEDALVAGTGITLVKNSPGGDETITVSSSAVGGGRLDFLLGGTESSNVSSITLSGWSTTNSPYFMFILYLFGLECDKTGNADGLLIQLNGDTTAANYDSQNINGADSTVTAEDTIGTLAGMRAHRVVAAQNNDADHFGICRIEIALPESTAHYKLAQWAGGASSATTNEFRYSVGGGVWENMAAITSITVLPELGTTFEIGGAGEPATLEWKLYGVY